MPETQPAILDLRDADAYAKRRPAGAVRLQPQELLDRPYLLPPRSRALVLVGRSAAEVGPLMRALERAGRRVDQHFPDETWDGQLPAETGTPSRDRVWEPAGIVRRALEYCDRRHGATALDVACGSGRDAVFLAMAGLQVTAIDLLPDALERVRDLAARHRVSVRTLQRDLSCPGALGDLHADLIVVVRFLERSLFADLEHALNPGGILAYETFLHGQPRPRPSNPRFLLRHGELQHVLRRLETLESTVDTATDTHVERLIARRPPESA